MFLGQLCCLGNMFDSYIPHYGVILHTSVRLCPTPRCKTTSPPLPKESPTCVNGTVLTVTCTILGINKIAFLYMYLHAYQLQADVSMDFHLTGTDEILC